MGLIRSLQSRNPGSPLWRILWWELICMPLSWAIVSVLYGQRWWGQNHIPRTGPVLLVCNHQSYLDLIVLGVGLRRHFHSMARATLFRKPAFAWMIRSLNAFAVDQSKSDLKAMRHAIDLLEQGHLVMVFPEGARTESGVMGRFNPGIMLLIKRARPLVVPMAVDGVYDIWKIGQKRPRWHGRTGAAYGPPIPGEQLLAMGSDEAMALLSGQVEQLRLEVRAHLRCLSQGQYPPPGAGDAPKL